MSDEYTKVSLSILRSDIKRINWFAEANKKKFHTQAEVFRHIIDFFFEQTNKNLKRDLIIHFIYPIILGCIATFGTISTQKLINILVEQNLYFQELHTLNGVFVVLGTGVGGLLIANIYLLKTKYASMSS